MTKEKAIFELIDKMSLLKEFGMREIASGVYEWRNFWDHLRVGFNQDCIIIINSSGRVSSFPYESIVAINIIDSQLQIVTNYVLE